MKNFEIMYYFVNKRGDKEWGHMYVNSDNWNEAVIDAQKFLNQELSGEARTVYSAKEINEEGQYV